MKNKRSSNITILLFCTGLVFLLLFLTTLVSSWIILFCVNSGIITEHPDTPLIPFLTQTGMVSILTGMALAPVLCFLLLRPIRQLIRAIHAVAEGNFQTKIRFRHLKSLQELADSFNQMTSELSGTEMLRSDFIQNFSHELKTPIMSISGFAKLLKKGNVHDKDRDEYLDIIIAECKRLTDLSSNILELSRAESISILTGVVPCQVSEQIRESILQLQQKWEEKEITFHLQLEDCQVPGRPDLLKQVWVNLIDNAVKFSSPGGNISIQAAKEHGVFRFRIQDQGPGMDRQTLDKIFQRFYQGDCSRAAEGNGLGLPLVRQILKLHHGAVRADSQPGKGSLFEVTLPG